jgi:hypothetical protein
MSKPTGRPTIFTQELADKICKTVATHAEGLQRLCRRFDFMPNQDTVNVWRFERPAFSDQYTRAKQQQAELMAESMEEVIAEIAEYEFQDKDGATRIDGGVIARARMLLDTRKWHASKLAPKIYGDKVPEVTIVNNTKEVAEKVAALNKENEKEF